MDKYIVTITQTVKSFSEQSYCKSCHANLTETMLPQRFASGLTIIKRIISTYKTNGFTINAEQNIIKYEIEKDL